MASPSRRRRSLDGVDATSVSSSRQGTAIKVTEKAKTTTLRIYTFGLKSSPHQVQVLSSNSLYDLVDIGLRVFNPRNGDTVNCHLWNVWVNAKLKFKSTQAKEVKLADIAHEWDEDAFIELEYDYRDTTYHKFKLKSLQSMDPPLLVSDFPRAHPLSAAPAPTPAPATVVPFPGKRRKQVARKQVLVAAPKPAPPPPKVDLNEAFPSLNQWCFRPGHVKELNFFQAGRKAVYAYLETIDQQMILMPAPSNSLEHYLECLDRASTTQRAPFFGWHSIIVLPQKDPSQALSQKLGPYQKELEPGFCDCHVVPATGSRAKEIARAFPKLSAFAGFRKDSTMKKRGWIRYKDRVLLLCVGNGSEVAHPNSPKGTAFFGLGPHVPANPKEDVLFGLRKKMGSLQELFETVEKILETLMKREAEANVCNAQVESTSV